MVVNFRPLSIINDRSSVLLSDPVRTYNESPLKLRTRISLNVPKLLVQYVRVLSSEFPKVIAARIFGS